MPRATISKRILEQLIQAKLSGTNDCAEVTPMPVQWRPRNGSGCNWVLPGFAGEPKAVNACRHAMERYLELLRSEFDVPEEG